MAKIDTDKLSPTERQALIHQLREDQRLYEQENILKVKAEFQAMALERGFTLGQEPSREEKQSRRQAGAKEDEEGGVGVRPSVQGGAT